MQRRSFIASLAGALGLGAVARKWGCRIYSPDPIVGLTFLDGAMTVNTEAGPACTLQHDGTFHVFDDHGMKIDVSRRDWQWLFHRMEYPKDGAAVRYNDSKARREHSFWCGIPFCEHGVDPIRF